MTHPDMLGQPDDAAMMQEAQQAMARRAQEYEAKMMHNFQMELGRLSGQAIVDKTNWEQKEADWTAERERMVSIIEQLNQRVVSLESSFQPEQAEQSDPQGDAEVEAQEQPFGQELIMDDPVDAPAPKQKAKQKSREE